jgi:hypothetical protein
MGHRTARVIVVAMAALGIAGVDASQASATKPDPAHKVTICHATASRTNPYVVITVDIASIVGDAGHGRSGVNAGDIIPPFAMNGYEYAGNNWDAEHQAIFDGGCDGSAPTSPENPNT